MAKFNGYRCLHMVEGGKINPIGLPAVRPGRDASKGFPYKSDAPPIWFTKSMQESSFRLNNFNPLFTSGRWRALWSKTTALTDGHSWGSKASKYTDYINHINEKKILLPSVMKGIIFGGMFLRAEQNGNYLICIPGIHAIDINKPMPSTFQILEENKYFVGTLGGMKNIHNFPQGKGEHVLIPFFLTVPTAYPVSWFERWNSDEQPNPLKIYHPKKINPFRYYLSLLGLTSN